MSPSTLRRYRAERLLRQEFGALREEVLGSVRRRLRARGVQLDGGDLEACYAQAWQGLYTAVAAGTEIANPGGWLTVVTFRRALDEQRGARARERAAAGGAGVGAEPASRRHGLAGRVPASRRHGRAEWGAEGRVPAEQAASEPDLAAALDDRARLRQLFEALRSRLSARECEAASLCYLQGLTRAQAAARMGISEARMTKLMEGRGPGRPGVAGKVGELLEAIRGGEWCAQQGSLMRGLAFGVLDPRGERYRLARLHQRECPACRAYVLSLRGLAAVLPPLPLPWALGWEAPTPPAHAGAGAQAGAGTGTACAPGAAGAAGAGGAAGGGWLVGGSVGTKLAVSCLLALSVGCVALTTAHHARAARRDPAGGEASVASAHLADAPGTAMAATALGGSFSGRSPATAAPRVSPAARAAAAHRAAARQAQREFGPEQSAPGVAAANSTTPPAPVTGHAASVQRTGPVGSTAAPAATPSGPPSHAEREFGPE